MSESSDSGPGRREVAHRLFAAEFEDAEFSYSESDEERAPNYVVTPTGARVNRLFVTGVLTELEQVNDDVLRARIVDPTGAFVVYAGQYQPEALAFLEAATPPLFVAVTGKARTFEPEDGDRVFTSVRPESISEVDAETRDRWVVQAAEQTVARVGRLASARQSELSGDSLQQALVDAGVSESDAAGATLALDYYDTTGDYLQAVRDLSLNAARVVAGERDEAGSLSRSPGDGADGPLAVLATMDLKSPSDGSSAESGVEAVGTETTESTAGAETAETATTDAETADAKTAEPTTETAPATEETSSGSEPTAPATATDDASSTDPTADPSTAGDETEGEPSTDPIAEPSAAGDESDGTTAPTASESTQSQPEAEPADESADEGSSDTLGDFDGSGDAATTDLGATEQESTVDSATVADNETDDEVGDFDTEFELDEDEREEIEAEYGTDFQSGTEVDDAGEAGIETPDPEDLAEAEAAAGADEPSDAGSAPDSHSATAAEATDAEAAAEPPAEDVDLEDAVMDVMSDLNDGSGADREAVITDVVDTYGADRDAVEDAIQDALMGGRCYEPDDDKLTPI